MIIQKAKQVASTKTTPVPKPKEEPVKRTRNRPYYTPWGAHRGQSVTAYKGRKEFSIKDHKGGSIELDASEVPSLILALLETDKKSKTHH
jgi:hypothetical protein